MSVLFADDLLKQAEYKQHPFGQVWQPFEKEAFQELAADVDRRGLDKEITLFQGMILEGWHRYLACLATKATPKVVEFKGSDLEAAELVHASGIRRHSSADQRYASFLMLCEVCPAFKNKYEELTAKGVQQKQGGKPLGTGGQRVDVVKAKAKAARVSKTTAKKVERVKKERPEVVADIAAGKTTANKELKTLPKKTKPGKLPKAQVNKVQEATIEGGHDSDPNDGTATCFHNDCHNFQIDGNALKATDQKGITVILMAPKGQNITNLLRVALKPILEDAENTEVEPISRKTLAKKRREAK